MAFCETRATIFPLVTDESKMIGVPQFDPSRAIFAQ